MAKFHLLKIRTSIDIFSTKKCKVTFGLKYISNDQKMMQLEPKSRPQNQSKNNNITTSHNTKRTYDKPNEQLPPKRWQLGYLNLIKYHLNTQKVKTVQKLTPKQANTENQTGSTALERSVV